MSKRTPKRRRARQMLATVPADVPTGRGLESWPGDRTGVTGRDPRCPGGGRWRQLEHPPPPCREGCGEPRRPGFPHPLPPAPTLCPVPRAFTLGNPRSQRQGTPGTGCRGVHRPMPRRPPPGGSQARHGGLHTILVREQVWGRPSLVGQRCRVGTPQVTPMTGGSWTSALEERLPHRSSWHSCRPRWVRCAQLSHSTRHCPS